MKCSIIAVVVMAVAFLGNVTVAEEAPGIPDEIIAELDWFVGTWKAEGKVGNQKQTGGITLRWAQTKDGKKVCLIGRFSYTTGDETRSGANIIGWNVAKECVEDRGFNDLGGNGTLYWFIESATKWRGEIVTVMDGEEINSKADLIKKGDSEIVIESVTDDGEVSRVEYTKVERKRKQRKE